jgi:protein ImuA
MQTAKNDIISKLQTDILRLQGFKQERGNSPVDAGLGPIIKSFPNSTFPVGCIHEFLSQKKEDATATGGFVAGLLSALMGSSGAVLWISASQKLFPPALAALGIRPDRIVFIDLKRERDVLWAMDEALKCGALAAVVGEMQNISFMESRRLQLAVEQSQVTGFILRNNVSKVNTTACVSRWNITSLASEPIEDLPGIGFPKWRVELLKVRNGKPGGWDVVWGDGGFDVVHQASSLKLQATSPGGASDYEARVAS